MEELSETDVLIGAAAVADYRPTNSADYKLKKSPQESGDFVGEDAGYIV